MVRKEGEPLMGVPQQSYGTRKRVTISRSAASKIVDKLNNK
jgi:hypothetical protein